jgi:hypothetical protein
MKCEPAFGGWYSFFDNSNRPAYHFWASPSASAFAPAEPESPVLSKITLCQKTSPTAIDRGFKNKVGRSRAQDTHLRHATQDIMKKSALDQYRGKTVFRYTSVAHPFEVVGTDHMASVCVLLFSLGVFGLSGFFKTKWYQTLGNTGLKP